MFVGYGSCGDFWPTPGCSAALVLSPPPEDEELEELESTDDWDLSGHWKTGRDDHPTDPSGKGAVARDDVVNVISDGIVGRRDRPSTSSQVRGNRVLVEPVEES